MKQQPIEQLRRYLSSIVIGAEEQAELLLIALVAGGHVLIEGPPGVGKTTLAKTLASAMSGDFKRLQFTPDLLPSDITGYKIYRPDTQSFRFIEGPVFSNYLLADEINRTSPRVQSALLESMNEGRVSIDGETLDLPKPFMVIATQNSAQSVGTFALPEPQLDRFLISMEMQLPSAEHQLTILRSESVDGSNHSQEELLTNFGNEQVLEMQESVKAMPASDELLRYIVALCGNLRRRAGSDESVSVRASLALVRASQAKAYLDLSPAVHPDHVQAVFHATMRHRVFTELDLDTGELISATLAETPVF